MKHDDTGLSSTALHHMEGASRRKLRQWCCGFKKPASRIHSENFASGVAMVGRLILFPEWAESGEHWILKVQQCSTNQRSSVDRQNLQLFLPLFRGMAFLWTSELTFVMAAYQCRAFWATSSSGARLDRKDCPFLEMRWKHHQTPSLHIPIIFPECVARVPVSLWGSGGWGCVRSTLRLRLQPSATVRNRSQPSAWGLYGRAYGKFCKRDPFWRVRISRCFVSRGRCGTSWHSDVCRKSCCVAGTILLHTFATFSEDEFQFSWQAQHFGRDRRHFAWHFKRIVLPVLCESHCQGCVKWRQGANSMAGVAFCERWWKLTDASHETSILEVHKKTRRKTSSLKLQSVKIGGSLARNACLDAPTCLVSSLWFSCGLAVSRGEAAKPLLFEGFQAGCHILFCGRHGALWHSNLFDNVSKVVLCGRRNTFAPFSQDELQFSWQAQHFGDLHRHSAWQAQHCRRVHCVL